jgi:hypothetical protein
MAAGKAQVRGEAAQETRKSRLERDDSVEEMMKNLKLTAAEADRLVDDDEDEMEKPIWALAGKILSEPKVFHINTISAALRPAWGNPKGLFFVMVGRTCSLLSLTRRGIGIVSGSDPRGR